MATYNEPHEHGMGLFTRSTMRWEIGMKVTVKNLPMHLVFGEYNGQECEVLGSFTAASTALRFACGQWTAVSSRWGLPSTSLPKLMLRGLQPWPSLNARSSWPPDCAESSATAHGARPRPWKRHDLRGVSHVFRAGLAITLEASPRNGSMCHRS